MTRLLHWHTARPADTQARRGFVCTRPERPTWDGRRAQVHPAQWELDVQSWIRGHRLATDETMLLGFDDQGLGAVVAWAEIDGPSGVLVQAVAVSVRHRGQGGQHAKEAAAVLGAEIEARARAAGVEEVAIAARIDHRNSPSKRLVEGADFIYDTDIAPGLGRWVHLRGVHPRPGDDAGATSQ